ncbi:hypothetical protein CMV_028245 [Castanea mollissima]|uniref:Secreted protein n=1 Tax=Castanea mollissima TaxID=60419 RepID=A0A8J4VCA9_9ROSI|nr:hypothetical protein CMV_028245 [Castanea mollissima]
MNISWSIFLTSKGLRDIVLALVFRGLCVMRLQNCHCIEVIKVAMNYKYPLPQIVFRKLHYNGLNVCDRNFK